MTEPVSHAPTIQDGNASLLSPKRRRGSALDQGFPTGKLLLRLVALVFILQGIAAWKVMNLERERETLTRRQALLVKDIEDYKVLTGKLPELRRERGDMEVTLPVLKAEVDALQKQRDSSRQELLEIEEKARSTSTQYKAIQKRMDDLSKEIGSLEAEFSSKTSGKQQLTQDIKNFEEQRRDSEARKMNLDNEIKKRESQAKELEVQVSRLQARHEVLQKETERLTGPSSDLARLTTNLNDIMEGLKKSPDMLKEAINQTVNGVSLQRVRLF